MNHQRELITNRVININMIHSYFLLPLILKKTKQNYLFKPSLKQQGVEHQQVLLHGA
jgi:hypothetical protein